MSTTSLITLLLLLPPGHILEIFNAESLLNYKYLPVGIFATAIYILNKWN